MLIGKWALVVVRLEAEPVDGSSTSVQPGWVRWWPAGLTAGLAKHVGSSLLLLFSPLKWQRHKAGVDRAKRTESSSLACWCLLQVLIRIVPRQRNLFNITRKSSRVFRIRLNSNRMFETKLPHATQTKVCMYRRSNITQYRALVHFSCSASSRVCPSHRMLAPKMPPNLGWFQNR
jgi:hypothetical protein